MKNACETLYHDIELTAADQSMLFYFYSGVISNGQQLETCIILFDTNKKNCVDGLNHQSRQHESVQLHLPRFKWRFMPVFSRFPAA
jgi:hypothetical protein